MKYTPPITDVPGVADRARAIASEAESIAEMGYTMHAHHTPDDEPPAGAVASLWDRLGTMHAGYLSIIEDRSGELPPLVHARVAERVERVISEAKDLILAVEYRVGTYDGASSADAHERLAARGTFIGAPLLHAAHCVAALVPAKAALDDPTPDAPAADTDAIESLSPAQRRAGESFRWVCETYPETAPEGGTSKPYTFEQWKLVHEHGGGDAYPLDDAGCCTVPTWDTWSRHVREYLKATEGRKRQRRIPDALGRSVVAFAEADIPRDG